MAVPGLDDDVALEADGTRDRAWRLVEVLREVDDLALVRRLLDAEAEPVVSRDRDVAPEQDARLKQAV